jgi:hypothetical protein
MMKLAFVVTGDRIGGKKERISMRLVIQPFRQECQEVV